MLVSKNVLVIVNLISAQFMRRLWYLKYVEEELVQHGLIKTSPLLATGEASGVALWRAFTGVA